jgi:hypothetical protein
VILVTLSKLYCRDEFLLIDFQMDSLLRWGIENSARDPESVPTLPREPIDPAIIDAILGKSDAEQMKVGQRARIHGYYQPTVIPSGATSSRSHLEVDRRSAHGTR